MTTVEITYPGENYPEYDAKITKALGRRNSDSGMTMTDPMERNLSWDFATKRGADNFEKRAKGLKLNGLRIRQYDADGGEVQS